MQRIINSKVKKARAKQQAWERKKIKWNSRKIIRYLAKQYKKTGETVISIDIYKFNEEKLAKVLDMLSTEKQIKYQKQDDLYIVTLIINEPKIKLEEPKVDIQEVKKTVQSENKPQEDKTTTEENQPKPEDDPDSKQFKPF